MEKLLSTCANVWLLMKSRKVRKSWFGTNQELLRLASHNQNQLITPASPSYAFKEQLECEQSTDYCSNTITAKLSSDKYEVILHKNENENPFTVTVSDILSLSMFSRRAVVDFGTTSVIGKPLTHFLLLENTINEEQWVTIQRGPPENEFTVDWIASETNGSEFQPIHPTIFKRIYFSPLKGRVLIRITWNPVHVLSTEGVYSFHHLIQFRVNDTYSLQAVIIGRLLPPVQKPNRSNPWLKGPQFPISKPPVTNRLPTLPKWIETPFVSSSEHHSRFDTKKEKPNIPIGRINLPPPVSEIRHPARSSSSTLRKGNQNQGFDLNNLDIPFLTSESSNSVLVSHSLDVNGSFVDHENAYGRRLKTVKDRRRSNSQPVTGTPTRDLSVFGRFHEMKELSSPKRSASTSNKLYSDIDSASGVNFLNSTATAFVSPRLVRSPALRGAACATVSTHKKRQGGNLFYNNVTSVLSEMSVFGLTQWLNGIFAPCIAANSYSGHSMNVSKDICLVGSSIYYSTLKRAIELLNSTAITVPGERIEREIDNGKLIPLQQISLRVDKGSQRRIQDLLMVNYAPIWLHLTVDSLTSSPSIQPKSSTLSDSHQSTDLTDLSNLCNTDDKSSHIVCLSKKINSYLFESFMLNTPILPIKSNSSDIKSKQASNNATRNDKSSTKLNTLSRDVLYNRHVIKRFIIFVWVMDHFKSRMLIKHDPCLFRTKSQTKSSSSLLLSFAQNFLYGENNLVRHMAYLGAEVKVNQTQLDEYQFTVENLAVDLRDGIRLVKLAELLIPTLSAPTSTEKPPPIVIGPGSLMSMVRFPAISRLQKIHNVGLALRAFQQYGQISMVDGSQIDPRDIVDGHREKTLTLLWCLLLRYQVLALLDHSALETEIQTLEIKVNSISKNIDEVIRFQPDTVENNDEEEDKNHVAHFKLLYWACLICRLYDVPITSLDESFTDGRALCYLLHHYLPTILPQGLIRQCTTHTPKSSVPIPNSLLIRNNLFNLSLFQKKLSILGDVPLLFPNFMSKPTSVVSVDSILPPGLVLTTLAYLVNRLVISPSEKHKLDLLIRDNAARIIQNSWRRFQDHMKFSQFKLVPYGREWRLQRKMIKASTTIQAYVRGYLVRKYVGEIRCMRNTAATVIQSYIRGFLTRRYVSRLHKSAVLIQSTWRSYLAFRSYALMKQLCIKLQAFSRGFLVRRRIAELRATRNASATIIQSYLRRYIVQRNIDNWHKSAIRIQKVWRCYHSHQKYLHLKQACLTIQRYVRGYHARKLTSDMRLIRTSAAIIFQSHFRGYLVRRQLSSWHRAAIQIQSRWRCYYHRKRYLFLKSWCISVQKYARGYLARSQLAKIQNIRNLAATVIQSYFRRFLVCREINIWHASALRIQISWRSHRSRKIITQFKETVSLILIRHNASRKIQRWWHICSLLRFLDRRRSAAVQIQAIWKGFQIRKHLFILAQSSKNSNTSTKISNQLLNQRNHLTSNNIPLRTKSALNCQNSKLMLQKEKTSFISFSPSEAKSLLNIHFRLKKAIERARANPNLTLASKARNALKQISESTSVNQIIEAIKFLEMATGLSIELCYWIVGLSVPNNLYSNQNYEDSPCVLIRFFQIMMACNRSVPHEDIFIAITGTFLNIGRHKNLASNLNLWWNPLLLRFKSDGNNENVDDIISEEFQTPSIVHFLSTQLRRHQSLPGLNTTESNLQITLSPSAMHKKTGQNIFNEPKLSQNPLSISQNMSLIEVLVGILQRTWRARPGTVSIRLFSRTCCVLVLLFNSAPSDLFIVNSCLVPTLQEIHEGLYRRSDPHSRFHLNFDPTGKYTNSLNVGEVGLKMSNADMKKLRMHLSFDLDWHFYPVKTRPNPLLAIQYLLFTVTKKMSSL
ncbi:unnamed protein product [Heterobilharzia americana]|nr:unnamed protein product [Heterobilharzia americana]